MASDAPNVSDSPNVLPKSDLFAPLFSMEMMEEISNTDFPQPESLPKLELIQPSASQTSAENNCLQRSADPVKRELELMLETLIGMTHPIAAKWVEDKWNREEACNDKR